MDGIFFWRCFSTNDRLGRGRGATHIRLSTKNSGGAFSVYWCVRSIFVIANWHKFVSHTHTNTHASRVSAMLHQLAGDFEFEHKFPLSVAMSHTKRASGGGSEGVLDAVGLTTRTTLGWNRIFDEPYAITTKNMSLMGENKLFKYKRECWWILIVSFLYRMVTLIKMWQLKRVTYGNSNAPPTVIVFAT